jgi:CubicO group peptidase (beta-lactamase class C family)
MLLLFVATGTAYGDKVDDYIKTQMQRRRIAGLSLAVVKGGKIIKAKGYGLANVETNTPATPETVYKIASISKQFLAAGIMLLVEEGKIGLDDKVSKYLDGTPETWKDMTVRHLLTHTSGIVEDPPGFEPFKAQPDADVVKSVYPVPLLFTPGEKWSYSNAGYFALGEILRKVSGRPWSEFLTERVFAPLGMTATRTTTTIDIVPHRASGYDLTRLNGDLKNAENWVAVRPSGAFLSTVLDLAKWDAALYSDTILKSSLREQMWTPVKLNKGTTSPYGFGWFLDPWQGHKRVDHQGGLPGFLSDFERFVDDKLTVIVMVNTTSADPVKIALNVAGFYVPALAPPVLKPIPDTEPEITAKVKAMITGFVGGNLDTSLFTPDEAPYAVKSGMADYLHGLGAILSIALVERKNEGDNRLYRYRVTYRSYSLLVLCGFNKENKITGFGIQLD